MVGVNKASPEAWEGEYLSIGITESGESVKSIWVPWKHDTNAYNMKTPDLWLSPEEVLDPAVLEKLGRCTVVGCYCFAPMENYSFLENFPHLCDLRIFSGKNLRDLSFMKGMEKWFQLHIEDASLEDLSPAFPENWREKGLHSYCVAFVGCKIRDISPMVREDIRLSELLICQPEGTNEKERWKPVRAGTYRYFEYREGRT